MNKVRARRLALRYCGREFTEGELDRIRQIIADPQMAGRCAISRAVCTALGWRKPDGGLKEVSCRVALLRMEADGLLHLPPARPAPPRFDATFFSRSSAPGPEVTGSRGDLGEVRLVCATGTAETRLWNELVFRYHYLGHQPPVGANLRYLAYAGNQLLAALGFGAAAWTLAPRDSFIGWMPAQRQARLHLVANNFRLLVLPWVNVRFLASSLLAQAARELPRDWTARYGFAPLLLEAFVETGRFRGTCYAAANWRYVGETQGRGKLDRLNRPNRPPKAIWLYPLDRRFRDVLTAPLDEVVPGGGHTAHPTPLLQRRGD